MLREISLTLLLVGVALAARSADQYIDNVLHTSMPRESAPLSNFNVVFGPAAHQGRVEFTRGNATNFNIVQRKSCSGPKLFRQEVTINCTLSIPSVVTTYQTLVRNGSQAFYVSSYAPVTENLVYVVVSGYQQNNFMGTVKSVRVDRTGSAALRFNGLPSTFNKFVKTIQDYYNAHVTREVYGYLSQRFGYLLARAVANKPMPRQ